MRIQASSPTMRVSVASNTSGGRYLGPCIVVIQCKPMVSGKRAFGIMTEAGLVCAVPHRPTHLAQCRHDRNAAQLPGMDVTEPVNTVICIPVTAVPAVAANACVGDEICHDTLR